MKHFSKTAAFLAALGLTACAEYPQNVEAAYIPSIVYKGATCYELTQERGRLATYVQNMARKQKRSAAIDTSVVTVTLLAPTVILWPAVLALPFTRDQHAQLAVARGHYDAINAAGLKQNCGGAFIANETNQNTWKRGIAEFPPI